MAIDLSKVPTKVMEMTKTILKHEGRYVNNKADRGGPTKFGITIHTLRDWRDTPVSAQDVKNLELDEAIEIYLTNYYYGPKIDRLPSDMVKAHVYDMSINHGPGRAYKLLSRTLADEYDLDIDETTSFNQDLVEGSNQAIAQYGEEDLNDAIVDRRIAFFKSIVANNPSQGIFLKGWLNRANSFYS